MKIKFFKELSAPRIRKRDGATLTHRMELALTTEDAVILSEFFERQRSAEKPTFSLIRALMLQMATDGDDMQTVAAAMAKVQTRAELAKSLSDADVNRAINLLKASQEPKPPTPPAKTATPIPIPRKPMREFVPEPRKR